MWRVDDCFIPCCFFLLLDVSIGCVSHSFQNMVFFFSIVLALSL